MKVNNYQIKITNLLFRLKHDQERTVPTELTGKLPSGKKFCLFVITAEWLKNKKIIQQLADWRAANNQWFPSQFCVTLPGTRLWAKEQLLEMPDRILFFLTIDKKIEAFAHLGFYRFNYKERSCEIDNVIRGLNPSGSEGAITIGLTLLLHWARENLHLRKFYLRVFADNQKALALYRRVGFRHLRQIPLVPHREKDRVTWQEAKNTKEIKLAKRFFIVMERLA